jgi:hypothetical protein
MGAEVWDGFAAGLGIDSADRKHDICLQAAGSTKRELSVLEHKPEVIDDWANGLRRRFANRPVAVCLETRKGPLIDALSKYEHLVLYRVNPNLLAGVRKAFSSSAAASHAGCNGAGPARKFLRQSIVEWAGMSCRYSLWADAFYAEQRARGKSHHGAVRALAFKWLRVLHRCWKTRTAYDEMAYLKALRERGRWLLIQSVRQRWAAWETSGETSGNRPCNYAFA